MIHSATKDKDTLGDLKECNRLFSLITQIRIQIRKTATSDREVAFCIEGELKSFRLDDHERLMEVSIPNPQRMTQYTLELTRLGDLSQQLITEFGERGSAALGEYEADSVCAKAVRGMLTCSDGILSEKDLANIRIHNEDPYFKMLPLKVNYEPFLKRSSDFCLREFGKYGVNRIKNLRSRTTAPSLSQELAGINIAAEADYIFFGGAMPGEHSALVVSNAQTSAREVSSADNIPPLMHNKLFSFQEENPSVSPRQARTLTPRNGDSSQESENLVSAFKSRFKK